MKDIINFIQNFKKDYLDEENYSKVHVKIGACEKDDNSKKWILNYLRIELLRDENPEIIPESYAIDKKAIIFQEVIDEKSLNQRIQVSNSRVFYKTEGFSFDFYDDLRLPKTYEEFKKKFNTNHFLYTYIECENPMNLIFINSLESSNSKFSYRDIVEKDYEYGDKIIYGRTLIEKVFGYKFGPPQPTFLLVFPIKTFEFNPVEKVIQGKNHLIINWDISNKFKEYSYVKSTKGKEESQIITNPPLNFTIEDDFEGYIEFGIYWKGTNVLFDQGVKLFHKRFSYFKKRPEDFEKGELIPESRKSFTKSVLEIKLNNLKSEKEFRENILIPILRDLGYENIKDTHGNQEFGKDIVFKAKNRFGFDEWNAMVVKTGNIHVDISKKENFLIKIIRQIEIAKGTKYPDLNYGKKVITNVFVVTSGKFTGNTYKGFNDFLSGRNLKGSVFFIDKDYLLGLY